MESKKGLKYPNEYLEWQREEREKDKEKEEENNEN